VSLGELSKNRSRQMSRLASVVAGRMKREGERRRGNVEAAVAANAAAGTAAMDQLQELAEETAEIEEL